MRYASCAVGARCFAAVVEGDTAIPLDGIAELGSATPVDVLAAATARRAGAVPLDAVRLRPVVPRPGKVICLGLNYAGHIAETRRERPEYPVLFAKFADALAGPYDDLVKPPESQQVDYEAELAIVIGRTARRIPEQDALQAVAGYTVANDVTMRDFQYKTHQWLQGKTWPASTPLGPFLVTPDEVGDPQELEITLERNGERLQHARVGDLLFPVPAIVALVSQFTPLGPGDVILTGTPGGVGYRRDPQIFLQAGDVVSVEVGGVGRIENRVVDEAVPE
jgi:acylpyruvate hydrolase